MQYLVKNTKNSLTANLASFGSVSLPDIEQVQLMKRIDHKFLLNKAQLNDILPDLYHNFYVLTINRLNNHSYNSTYFDTFDLSMYMAHHNQRADRFKIRQRIYNTSGDAFLEIKHKNNKGLTLKTRMPLPLKIENIPYHYFDFVTSNSIYHPMALRPVMDSSFFRFTLVNRQLNQRVTVDTELTFSSNGHDIFLPDLVVVEVKSAKSNIDKTIFEIFRKLCVKPTGMSKYCVGMAMLNPTLKQNLFKQKINHVKKLCYAC